MNSSSSQLIEETLLLNNNSAIVLWLHTLICNSNNFTFEEKQHDVELTIDRILVTVFSFSHPKYPNYQERELQFFIFKQKLSSTHWRSYIIIWLIILDLQPISKDYHPKNSNFVAEFNFNLFQYYRKVGVTTDASSAKHPRLKVYFSIAKQDFTVFSSFFRLTKLYYSILLYMPW